MTRRQALRGVGALLVGGTAACDASSGGPTPPVSTPPLPPLPPTARTAAADASLRSAAAGRVRGLLASYDAALAGRGPADPARAPLLALRADHAAHLEALTAEVPVPAPTVASPTATEPPAASSPSPAAAATAAPVAPSTPTPGPVPVEQLLATERRAEDGNAGDVGRASRELARLLASIAACEASHQVPLASLAAS